jgi:hypothetical protein
MNPRRQINAIERVSSAQVQANLAILASAINRPGRRRLYPNEIEAGKKIINICLETGFCWSVLLAQMQSGKTNTYYFVIAEMIRKGRVGKGVIFSGSSEKELRDQVEDSKNEFFVKYKHYLCHELNQNEEDNLCKDSADDLCDYISKCITVVWSSELKKYNQDPRNTFFVWDESHYAQNQGMRPGDFLRNIGICPTGDTTHLYTIGSYLLSVSATPFSEISDNSHLEQQKRIVKMVPGENYYGVRKQLEGNKVQGFSNWRETLKLALEIHKGIETPCWAILRKIPKVSTEEIRDIAQTRRWRVVEYDSEAKDIQMTDLSLPPEVNTLIVLKGMLRMGKRLKKPYISFAMEMSKSSSSDVVLQGLLGRLCGYDANPNIVVYIHEKILARGDLEKYVQLMDYGENVIVSKARNLVSDASSRSMLNEIIPLKITQALLRLDGSDDIDPCTASRAHLISSIKAAVIDRRVEDLNDPLQSEEIVARVESYREQQFKIANIRRGANETYEEVPLKISVSIASGVPMKLGSGCGINAAGTEIGIFVFHDDYPSFGIRRGDVFVDARTEAGSHSQIMGRNIPKTNKKEIFCRQLELGEEVDGNGAYTIDLPAETSENQELMLDSLNELIQLSIQPTTVIIRPRKITSIQTGDEQFKGIIVTIAMFESLKPRGNIYETLKRTLRVKLVVKKPSGPQPASLVQRGMVRLAEISW